MQKCAVYVCVRFCVGICCKLLFAVHAILSETFSEGVGVDLQLCDLKIKTIHILILYFT